MGLLLRGLTIATLSIVFTNHASGQDAQSAESQPTVILADMFLIDMFAVDGANQSFHADLFVRLSWHDPTLVGHPDAPGEFALNEIWHPLMLFADKRSVTRGFPDVLRVDGEGNVSYIQRVTGDFSSRMDLRAFPADSQLFDIHMVVASTDSKPIEVRSDPRLIGPFGSRSEQLSISDWDVGEVRTVLREYSPAGTRAFPGLALEIPARRLKAYYVIQVLLPVIAILMMAWAVFWVDPAVVPTRVGTVATTMLTLIAYRFILASKLPNLTYLTRIDYFVIGTLGIVVTSLFMMAAAAFLNARGKTDAVRRIDIAGRVLYPIAFLVLIAISWF